MPITKTAKRSLKKSLKRREANASKKEIIKNTKKQFLKLLAAQKFEEAHKTLNLLYKLFDKAVKTHLIKKNAAARYKSRLTKKLLIALNKEKIKEKRG